MVDRVQRPRDGGILGLLMRPDSLAPTRNTARIFVTIAMPKYDSQCPDCQSPVAVHVGQFASGGILNWHLALRCERCGAALEGDGHDETPEEIRAAILAEAGEWELHRSGVCNDKLRLTKSLRRILNLSPIAAIALTNEESGILFRGTRAEVEWVAQNLELDHIDGSGLAIRPVEVGSS